MPDSPYETEQWLAKTSFPIGVDLTQAPPEMRYQLLEGRVFTLQLFPGGDVAKGELAPADLDFELQGEGWYDGFGAFLGDDPQFPEWE
jgi:hypothetical protein